jgi:hypothetical protein
MKKATIFAVWDDKDGLFVELQHSGIPFLVALIDGLPLTIESTKKGRTYIACTEALAWHRKEYADFGNDVNRRCAEALEQAIQKFNAGDFRDA